MKFGRQASLWEGPSNLAIPRWMKALLAAALVVLLLGGALLYHTRNQAILRDVAERLTIIGRFKADEIARWRAERLSDAAVMAENPFFQQGLAIFIADPREANAAEIRSHLSSIQTHNHFTDIRVFDLEGRTLLDLSGKHDAGGAHADSLVTAFRERKPVLTELHTDSLDPAPHISAVVPIFADDRPTAKPLCAVVMVCDASQFLYPLIQSWPTSSKTAQTNLIRRDGDQVLFLSNPPELPGAALKTRRPMSQTNLPSVMAVNGAQGFREGKDYRGVDVVAVGMPVPGSPWFLVVKEDLDEVFSEWRSRIVKMAALLAGIACGLGAVGLTAVQRYLRVHHKNLYRAEAGLRASEEKWRSVVATSPDGISIHSMDGVLEEASERTVAMFGYDREEELIGKPLLGVLDSTCHEKAARLLGEMVRDHSTGPGEYLAVRKDGTRFNIESNAEILRNSRGEPAKIIFIIRDITGRKQAEEANQQLMVAIDQSADSIVFTDLEGKILYVNQGFEKATGYTREETLGRNSRMLKSGKHPEAFYRSLWKTISSGEVWEGHFENKRKDGSAFEEDATISPIHNAAGEIISYVAVKRDVTREVLLERQLFEAQKMEAIGQLAGGMAHDYNNILAANLMGLEMLMDDPGLAGHSREMLQDLKKGEERAANLTRQLLMFSRRQVMQLKTVDLNELLEEEMKMLRRLLGEQIDLTFQAQTGPAWIEADMGMIEQVIMNLCINARDAMPKGGLLTVGVKLVEIDGLASKTSIEAPPGKYARLCVADVGCGMSEETQKRIFEPFFTTKEVGKGTGLGLSTVYGIVKQHKGWVEVSSTLGKGSEFCIFLPASVAKPAAPAASTAPKMVGGTETILVVEDEQPVRKSVVACLKQRGYQVFEASDAREALRLWSEQAARIDLLLTDMIMPGAMTGLDLIDAFLQLKPALPAIIMSGYSNEIALSGIPSRPGLYYLPKPYNASELADAVRKSLDPSKPKPV